MAARRALGALICLAESPLIPRLRPTELIRWAAITDSGPYVSPAFTTTGVDPSSRIAAPPWLPPEVTLADLTAFQSVFSTVKRCSAGPFDGPLPADRAARPDETRPTTT